MGIFVVLSASRTAIIATFCSCIIFYAENTKDFRQQLLRQKTTIVILLVILCVCLYYCKHASADGRLLIWRVSVNMIADKPFLGWGKDGFDAFYMPYQADYFITHPNSKFQLLADNIIHPFNEFLLFTIKYGMIGLVLLICFIILFFQNIMKYSEEYKDLWITLSSTIFIWSLFSYPYQIPFIWLVTVYIVSVNLFTITIRYKYTRILALCTCLTCIFILTCSIKSYKKKFEWIGIQEKALNGDSMAMQPQYERLYKSLKDNAGFLYNYGAELHYVGLYKKSLLILCECSNLYNDYNVQMLMAHNYQQMGFMDKAIDRYEYAGQMVPNRFLPLYYMMGIYIEKNDTANACRVADLIVKKPVKIKKSGATQRIINEARSFLQTTCHKGDSIHS